MKLIPEQVINLRREINEARNNISEYKDYLIDKNSMSRDDICGTCLLYTSPSPRDRG